MGVKRTISVPIPPELDDFINRLLSDERYPSECDIVLSALWVLEQFEYPGETRRVLKEELLRAAAEAERGELLDGERVFKELRERSARLREEQAKPH